MRKLKYKRVKNKLIKRRPELKSRAAYNARYKENTFQKTRLKKGKTEALREIRREN